MTMAEWAAATCPTLPSPPPLTAPLPSLLPLLHCMHGIRVVRGSPTLPPPLAFPPPITPCFLHCRAFVSCGEARSDALTVGALPQQMHRSATLVQVRGGGGREV